MLIPRHLKEILVSVNIFLFLYQLDPSFFLLCDDRPTPEQLYEHEIFQEKDGNDNPILLERDDMEEIDNLVRLSNNDQKFRVFQEKLAYSNQTCK